MSGQFQQSNKWEKFLSRSNVLPKSKQTAKTQNFHFEFGPLSTSLYLRIFWKSTFEFTVFLFLIMRNYENL